ncbi:hypothetical protein BH10PSE13_BH10PSE13_18360 [soil metagenome]
MRKTVSLLALAGIFALSACDWGKKKEDDEVLPLNDSADEVVNNAAEVVPDLAPVRNEALDISNSVTPPAPPPVTQDQQTLDAADATGLTSRLPEENVLGEAAGNSAR